MTKKVLSKFVSFYITYRDINGFEHHTVNRYDRLSGSIEMLKDHIFDRVINAQKHSEDNKNEREDNAA